MSEPKKPLDLRKLMREAAVPMPASSAPPATPPSWGRRGRPVPMSRDVERVLALPRREPLDLNSPRAEAMVQLITERYSNGIPAGGLPGSPCQCRGIDPRRFKDGANGCVTSVLPIQAWALFETGLAGGCIGSIVVGGGKTFLNILCVFALGVQKALVLIPSNLLNQFWRDYKLLAEHFKVPSIWVEGIKQGIEIEGMPKIFVLPYGLLSRPGRSAYIDDLKPEAIICDETDKLADIRGSATARRVLRYYVENSDVKFAGWTGSLTDKKIGEYGHLLAMAFKEQSPAPLDPQEIVNWGTCIDVQENPAEAGALRLFMNPEESLMQDEVKAARRAYGRRLSDTLGVITTSENSVEVAGQKGTSIEIVLRERPAPLIPPRVEMALEFARGFVRPDAKLGFSPKDEELESPTERARTISEIASGIMNVWEFPPTNPERTKFLPVSKGGIPQENAVIDEWYERRAPWNKAVRSQCLAGVPYMDSPHLCELAAARYYGDLAIPPCPSDDTPENWARKHPMWPAPEWPDWRDIRKKVKPMAVAKRIDDYLVRDAAKWATENRGIVWYSYVEFGRWVSELSGLPMHGGGPKAEDKLLLEKGDRSIIASIDSHGRGRNGLQFLFSQQLLAQIPASARRWEQLLGRLIRRGQTSFDVITWVYLHVPELRQAIETAVKKSEYVEDTLRMRMKLMTGWEKFAG